ncbi:MAG: SGNH/GDSL hydrolase family protein [Armatimonadetes bacterium]|nr:SGNH/GDSL hydrolase family protein [Armatimonadota bacterium]
MNKAISLLLLSGLCLLGHTKAAPNSGFFLHPGDRVLFYGDSITDQKIYTNYLEAFVLTRYPGLKVEYINRGWSGEKATGGWGGTASERVARDVAGQNATVLTVMLGMNDGEYKPFSEATQKTFESTYNRLLDMLQTASAPSCRFTLMRSSPWDDYTRDEATGYNTAVQKYGEVVAESAKRRKWLYVDFNQPLVDVMTSAKKADPKLAQQIVPDWIHPGPPGHLVMLFELLKAWKANPVVSQVTLDAKSKKVLNAQQAEVGNFSGLEWTQTDDALDFAPPEGQAEDLVRSLLHFDQEMNRHTLSIKNLQPGTYRLTIDGELVGEFTDRALEQGLNLASLKTPMMAQSGKVVDLVWRKNELEDTAWRNIEYRFRDRALGKKAAAAIRVLRDEIDREAQSLAKPKARRYKLMKLSG